MPLHCRRALLSTPSHLYIKCTPQREHDAFLRRVQQPDLAAQPTGLRLAVLSGLVSWKFAMVLHQIYWTVNTLRSPAKVSSRM